ncbi:hypothetical protein C1H76_2661 [Elsinoe australis]|uniref:PD-(D/E)XK nuclease-like domain-containing protein n=1 Tax=Elsinoe australis TaxID=40998 RepID=A0A4U7B5R3_9PEZI|nr:hypothetical protein C1H76_2661 [Elsinoe australis]
MDTSQRDMSEPNVPESPVRSSASKPLAYDPERTPVANVRNNKRYAAMSADDSISTSSKKSRSSTSSYRSESYSPGKPAVLQSLITPIRTEKMAQIDQSKGVSNLLRRVRQYAAGIETIPYSQVANYRHRYQDDGDLIHEVGYNPDSERSKLGSFPDVTVIEALCSESIDCRKYKEQEPAWNTQVHGPVLFLAKSISAYTQDTSFCNITRAKIMPQYIPRAPDGIAPLSGKMVDFALTLNPDAKITAMFNKLPFQPGIGKCFNHTNHAPIVSRPIAISIESKSERGDSQYGITQLQTWVAAHYNRLQDVIGPEVKVEDFPTLPLLLVQGPRWNLYMAQRRCIEGIWETVVFETITIGETISPSGCCKVLAVLLLLMQWAASDFREWCLKYYAAYNDRLTSEGV